MSLYSDVRDGRIKLSLILSLPRTVSTALTRSLAVSASVDGYMMQPFDDSEMETNSARNNMRTIQKYAEQVRAEQGTPEGEPVHLLLKDMAYSFSTRRMRNLARHCDNVVVLLRDPHFQAFSHLKALSKLDGKAPVTKTNLHKFKMEGSDAEAFFTDQWEHMEDLVQVLEDEHLKSGGFNLTIVDGDIIRAFPYRTLEQLSERMGIEYTDAMVDGWSPSGQQEKDMKEHFSNAYMGRSTSTRSMKPPDYKPPPLMEFPIKVRPHVENALASYTEILAGAQTLRPTAEEFAEAAERSDGQRLMSTFDRACPITTYAHLATSGEDVDEVLTRLRRANRAHKDAFTVIDDMNPIREPGA